MNSDKSKNGFDISQNVNFLGRSGVIELKGGIRIGFISGIDSDLLGEGVCNDASGNYKGAYFGKADIDKVLRDYSELKKKTNKEGIDIFLCG